MTSFPTVTWEAALVNYPMDDTPTFTTFTSSDGRTRLISATVNRALGRAGTSTSVLDNSDGLLNQWNTASAYYGNLLEGITANPETSTAGWTVSTNSTLATSTFDQVVGAGSLEITATLAGSWSVVTTNRFNVVAGKVYTPSIQIRTREHTENINVTVRWWDDGGVSKGSDIGGNVVVGASFTQLGGFQVTAPVGATKVDLFITGTAIANADRAYLDAAQFQAGTVATWGPGGRNGNLRPRLRVRLKAVWAGVTYYLFTHYVTAWGTEWENIKAGDCAVSAIDAFKLLTLIKRPRTDFRDQQLASSPAALYGFDETSRTQPAAGGIVSAVDSSGNGRDASYKGEAPTFETTGALPAEIGTAVGFKRGTANQGSWVEVPITACPSGTGDWSVEAWVRPRSFASASPVDQIWHVVGVGSQSAYVVIDSNGKASLTANTAPAGGTLPSTTALTLGEWNHVVAVKSGTTGPANWAIYLNGVDVSDHAGETLNGTGNVSMTANSAFLAGYDVAGVGQGALDGDLDEVAIYFSALSSGTVTAHYDAGFGLVAPALSGDRVDQVLDFVGVPAGDRDVDSGQFMMQPVHEPLHDTPPLAYILTGAGSMVESEGWPAAFFIAADGTYVYQDRGHSAPASSATFSDASSTLYYDPGPGPVRNDENLWTQVVLQAINGEPQTAGNAEDLGETLTRTGLRNADDADVATMAADLYDRYSVPQDRIERLVIHPVDEPATMWPQVLGRELNDVITLARTDLPGTGATFSGQFRIVGISHQIESQDWHCTFELEPA